MTTREIPNLIVPVRLVNHATHTTAVVTKLDTSRYLHGLKGASAAAFVWSVGAYTSGEWSMTFLQESDSWNGPWALVDRRFTDGYHHGVKLPESFVVDDAQKAQTDYLLSYHGGLKRYLQITIAPVVPGTLAFSIGGLLYLTETMEKVFTDYTYEIGGEVQVLKRNR